jgi:hypothetical protein
VAASDDEFPLIVLNLIVAVPEMSLETPPPKEFPWVLFIPSSPGVGVPEAPWVLPDPPKPTVGVPAFPPADSAAVNDALPDRVFVALDWPDPLGAPSRGLISSVPAPPL